MLTDDDIRKFGFESGLLRLKDNTITRWKDGIDIDYPVLAVEKFASAVERAAYEAAIKACESLENRVISTHPARIEFDPNSLMARKCADVIRSLMTQEQPK